MTCFEGGDTIPSGNPGSSSWKVRYEWSTFQRSIISTGDILSIGTLHRNVFHVWHAPLITSGDQHATQYNRKRSNEGEPSTQRSKRTRDLNHKVTMGHIKYVQECQPTISDHDP
jgi:hypothetical protein